MRLREWQDKHGVSDDKLAESLETSRQNVWAWKVGIHAPSARLWERLKKETDYEVSDLDEIADEEA